MADPFDAREYFAHLRSRWRPAAVAVTVALAGSLSVSLLLPKKYTARVSLIIEPPASSDSRTATAVTPIYLESLKTYERFASSDDLFARALERFRLRNPSSPKPIENLKREILRVSVPQSTKIMEITATYGDPKLAHSLALFLAEETVKLNQKTGRAGDEELIAHGKRSLEAAARRLLGLNRHTTMHRNKTRPRARWKRNSIALTKPERTSSGSL